MPEQLPGASPNDPMHEYATHYPEVVQAGSLQNALQDVVDRAGYGLTVELTSSPGWRLVAATVAAGGRSANVLMTLHGRGFSVDCWTGQVHMASGLTEDLAEVAGAMHAWLRVPLVRELVAQWPFLRTWELAEAHERGEAIPVRWRQLREAAKDPRHTVPPELVEAAFAQPRLRALSPGRSMYWLTFSRSAEPPICRDLPRVMSVGEGRYRIRFADGRLEDANGAAEAVELVLDDLPDDADPTAINSC